MEQYIRPSVIKRAIKAAGKRSSPAFLEALNVHVNKKVEAAIACHNGGKKTLDHEVAVWCGLKG
jgi:hypothetical protein